jgi:hypothetical protein
MISDDLAGVLAGRYADVRARVREQLIPHAGLLQEADELPR